MGWIAGIGAIVGGLLSADAAGDSAQAAAQAAELQYKIATRIQDREDELFELWRTEYKGCELALKNAVCNLTSYEPQYETAARRSITQVRRQFARARRDALACLDAHCVGAACGITRDIALAEASAASWAANVAIKVEDEKKLVRDQQVLENKFRVAALGHQSYFSTAGSQLAATIYGRVGDAAARMAASNSGAAGYYLQRAVSNFGRAFGENFGQAPTFNVNFDGRTYAGQAASTQADPFAGGNTFDVGSLQSNPLEVAPSDFGYLDVNPI